MNASTGKLWMDREFALVDSSDTAMRLQTHPRMAFLRPQIDAEKRTMTVFAPGRESIELALDESCESADNESSMVTVCGNQCGALLWGDIATSDWFSEYLGVQCWLSRHSSGQYLVRTQSSGRILRNPGIAFANEQPLLLISEHAVDLINETLSSRGERLVSSKHFRPNMVVRLVGQTEYSQRHTEDGWKQIELTGKDTQLEVVGHCARCSMVDVDPSSGMKGKTLRALSDYRREKNGQITFGIFLRGRSNSIDSRLVRVEEGDLLFCQ